VTDDRRAYQRLTLAEPLDGWFGDFSVRLVDVSASGAQIEHEESIPDDARGLLRFYWRGEEVEILAETARLVQPNRLGVRFLEESDALRTLISISAGDVLRALEANARGDREANMVGEETLTSVWRTHATGYIRWELDDGHWTPRHALTPEQPEHGFTICASESEEQVAMLRRTYEGGDTEARRLTRMLAELSVLDSM
jgi:PilZ domain